MIRRTLFLTLLSTLVVVEFVAAAPPDDTLQLLSNKLEIWDVEAVWPQVTEALSKYPQNPELLEIAAHIAFYRGDYQESLDLIKRSAAGGGDDERRIGFTVFVEDTIRVLAPYRRYETEHFIILLDETRDGILVDYLSDALEKTYQVMAQRYGFEPREKVRVELFPDTQAFYFTSTLSVRDIEVTGAVGLAKFNKLQFLSPRALIHGYRWLDAISHEYMHYLIVKMTANNAPIWFHEGLAKYEETRWRDGPGYLSAQYQTLLAQAQSENKLIGFSQMEPSLVHLESPAEVQLAYAQAASAVEFIISTAGYDGLKKIVDQMAWSHQKGAADSIRTVLGLEFSEFEKKWAAYLADKALRVVPGASIQRFKVKQGSATDDRMELQEIKSIVARNRAHLGDRLKARGRMRAAVLEYRRALSETEDSVPVMNRLAGALIDLGRDEEALDMLSRILALAPDHPTPYLRLGQVRLKRQEFTQAKAAFEESLQINPFNPEVHIGLANTFALLGDRLGSEKERQIVNRIIR
ncbi:MAG: tetratricopeptide repeat protein [Desulfobacterales bacterium]|nr:MAG: tetratricopeptide repeat protein [Desulfobacterales bacterium]